MDLKTKKIHSIIIEVSEDEARDIADFLDRMDDEGILKGEDTVMDLNVRLHHQFNIFEVGE